MKKKLSIVLFEKLINNMIYSTLPNIYDGGFLQKYLTRLELFPEKNNALTVIYFRKHF